MTTSSQYIAYVTALASLDIETRMVIPEAPLDLIHWVMCQEGSEYEDIALRMDQCTVRIGKVTLTANRTREKPRAGEVVQKLKAV